MVERELLHDDAAVGDAGHVGALDAEVVEQADDVVGLGGEHGGRVGPEGGRGAAAAQVGRDDAVGAG